MCSDWSRIASYLAQITPRKVIIIPRHIFKMASSRFLDVSEEEINKMKENEVALIITFSNNFAN